MHRSRDTADKQYRRKHARFRSDPVMSYNYVKLIDAGRRVPKGVQETAAMPVCKDYRSFRILLPWGRPERAGGLEGLRQPVPDMEGACCRYGRIRHGSGRFGSTRMVLARKTAQMPFSFSSMGGRGHPKRYRAMQRGRTNRHKGWHDEAADVTIRGMHGRYRRRQRYDAGLPHRPTIGNLAFLAVGLPLIRSTPGQGVGPPRFLLP